MEVCSPEDGLTYSFLKNILQGCFRCFLRSFTEKWASWLFKKNFLKLENAFFNSGFTTNILRKVPWLSLTFCDSASMTFRLYLEVNYRVHTFFLSLNSSSLKYKIYIISRIFYSLYMFIIIRLHLPLQQVSLLPHIIPDKCVSILHTGWWTKLETFT